MSLCLVMGGVRSVRRGIILVMVMRGGLVVIVMGKRRARMGKKRKGVLSANSMVYNHMHGGEKKSKDNPTAYKAHHG